MTRKRFIKLLMGNLGVSRDEAVWRAGLVNSFNIPYEASYNQSYLLQRIREGVVDGIVTVDSTYLDLGQKHCRFERKTI